MKKIINYYGLFILILFIINNILLKDLIIGGKLYFIAMLFIIIINGIIIIVFKNDIKYKAFICLVYCSIVFFSKDLTQGIFLFSNIFIISLIIKNNYIKIITIIIIFLIIISFPIFLIKKILFKPSYFIYPNTYYSCNNNYEGYTFSAGAMDKYHYVIALNYQVLSINDTIYIRLKKPREVSGKEYNTYIQRHICKLKDDNK